MTLKKALSITLVATALIGVFSLSGCKRKPGPPPQAQITINYYKLFDNTASVQDIINAFEKQHPHININYKKFTDPEAYEDLIINEIAEGGGPDIFSLPNTWIKANYKKIQPAPEDLIPFDAFQNTFLDIAQQDLVYATGPEGTPQIYGLPLTIDTLALYYNQDHFEKHIPERGKPGGTWAQFTQDVTKLRRLNNGQIIRAAAAIGRGDNVARSTDILYTLMLQYGTDFYAGNNRSADFDNTATKRAIGLITSFAEPNEETATYTWSEGFLDPATEDEITKFINGDISMLFGYSHLYKNIIDQIKIRQKNNKGTIEAGDVRISTMPQVSTDPDEQLAYAHYFAESVSRTSKHPRESWAFLRFMINQQNLKSFYKEGGFKPTSRRDLIVEQRKNAIYRPFIEQLGYARTIPLADEIQYREIFKDMLTKINNGTNLSDALSEAQRRINQLIPPEGVEPPALDL